MNKVEKLVGAIFAMVGGLFLVIGLIMFANANQKTQNWTKTTAIISEIIYRGDSEKIMIQYEVNGEMKERRLNVYSSWMEEGKEMEIWYNPQSPAEVHTNVLDILHWMFMGMGSLFFILGSCFFVIPLVQGNKQKKLAQDGEMIRADIMEIAINRGYSVNGRHPYYISCRWRNPENGQYYLFRSENIWYNPQDMLDEKKLCTLPVYLDPKNYKRYYVSLEDIKVNDYQ